MLCFGALSPCSPKALPGFSIVGGTRVVGGRKLREQRDRLGDNRWESMGHPSNWKVSRNPLGCAGHLHYDSGHVPKDIVNIQIQIGKHLLQKGQGGRKLVLGLKSQTMNNNDPFLPPPTQRDKRVLATFWGSCFWWGPLVITAWEVA